ncbi:MAG: hypothetical protein J6V29_04045, partial [Bacteroidales bacterium]|nr:hypothetical protein [Bacteroidales bacterium]
EEVLAIEEYCAEHKVTHKARLAELGIQFWDFYKAKKKYREEDSMDTGPGQFVQLSSGRCVPSKMPAARTVGRTGKQDRQSSSKAESYLTIELQTRCGTAMRIQGMMTPDYIKELISASNV